MADDERPVLRFVGPPDGPPPVPAFERATAYLEEAAMALESDVDDSVAQALATIGLGWATLALTEPRQ